MTFRRRSARPSLAATLVYATPLVLGAVALAIWLRRLKARRMAPHSPAPAGAGPPPAPSAGPLEPPQGAIHAPGRAPIDIVAVVDDLLIATQ